MNGLVENLLYFSNGDSCEAVKYRQANQLLRQPNLSSTKYAEQLSRANLRIFTGLLTGHADLNRYLALMQM